MSPSACDAEQVADIRFRPATVGDAERIAQLHADSWRRNYRGAYSDTFLDGDVVEDRRSVWTKRLGQPRDDSRTFVAETADRVVGFAHTILDDDATWGALLDNLHVAHSHARRGIGSSLLRMTAATVADERPDSALYLWVLEQNLAAQAFYAAHGGLCVERDIVRPQGGVTSRLQGTPGKLRFVWPHPKLVA